MYHPAVEELYDDDESYVEGEDPWADFDDKAVEELAVKYKSIGNITDHAERLAQTKALIVEMNA